MYTRCHSITSFFQKTILLKDSKYNAYMHRKLHSESIFTKSETKLKPLKRCFSGAPKNKNFSMGPRSVEGVGFSRKDIPRKSLAIPQFPRELVQRMPPRQFQHNFISQDLIRNQESLVNFPVAINNSARNEKGSITIVIDKSDICNCTSPNEDITIHVTTKPKITPKQLIEGLSATDLTEICNAKYSRCQRCEELKKSSNPGMFHVSPNLTLFQPSDNSNKFNLLPTQQKSLPGIPLRNLPTISEGFNFSQKKSLPAKRSRSMDNFRTMRKMIVPNGLEPKIEQLPMNTFGKRQQHPQAYKGRSESRQFPSASLNKNQRQLTMQRTSEPNLEQRRRNSSFQMPFSRNKALQQLVSKQQTSAMRRQNFVQRENQFSRPRQQNNVPLPIRSNLNSQETVPTSNGGGEMKINEILPFKGQQSQNLVNRVLRRPTLDPSNSRFWSKRDVTTPNITNAPVGNQEQTFGKLLPRISRPPPNIFEVSRQPKFNTQLQTERKNRFPDKRRSNSPGGISSFNQVKLRPLTAPRPVESSMGVKNYVPKIHSEQKRATPFSRETSLPAINQSTNFHHKKPPVIQKSPLQNLPKKTSFLGLNSNTQTRNIQQQMEKKNLIPQQQPHFALKQRSSMFPPQQTRQSNSNTQRRNSQQQMEKKNLIPQQQPHFALKKRSSIFPPQQTNSNTQRRNSQQQMEEKNLIPQQQPHIALKQRNLIFPPQQMNRKPMNVVNKQPPRLVLKKRNVPRRAFNSYPQIKSRQQQHFRLQKNFPPQQTPLSASRQRSPTIPVYRKSLIPVPQNKGFAQRNFSVKPNFPQKQPISRVPKIMLPARNSSSLIPVHKNRSNNFLRKNIAPLPHINLRRRHPIVPFGIHSNQRRKSSQDTFAPPTQRQLSMLNPRPRRNEVRKMNQDKLQSSLPMNIMNLNQSEKYVGIPKSTQSDPTTKTNVLLQNIPQIRTMPQMLLPPMRNFLTLEPLQKKCQIPQPPLKYYRKSALRTRQPSTRKDKFKGIRAKYSKTDNVNIASSGNPAVLFYAPGKLKLVDTPVPRLTDKKGVIVKMLYVHLTDADAQMLASKLNGPYKLNSPAIAGRSGSGVVVDVGKQVKSVKIGDTVSIKPIFCGKCSACKNNNTAMCKRIPTSEKFGILKRFHAIPAKFVTRLPEKVNPIDGAMMDELSSAIRACKKSAVTAGDNVLVLDGGSLGLWTVLAAKSMGATNVCLADTRNSVLEQAKKFGIDRLFLINPNSPTSNTAISISDYMGGDDPRVVFDCSGSTLTNQIAINAAKIGGKVVLMKNIESNQPIVLSDAINREIDILVSQHGNKRSERAALQFLGSGKVQLNGINSCLFDISNVHEAFRSLNSGSTSNIFIQLNRLEDKNNTKKDSKTS